MIEFAVICNSIYFGDEIEKGIELGSTYKHLFFGKDHVYGILGLGGR